MSENLWTVKPEDVQIELEHPENGTKFWIKVKKYLTVGETRRVSTAGWRSMSSAKKEAGDTTPAATEIQIDWRAQTFARTEAYLIAWSLTNDGVPMTRDGIESLDPAVYEVIENAISAHVEAMDLEKKARRGSSEPRVTLAS